MQVAKQDIDKAKTSEGGWTQETLAQWGVPWPPPRGWRKRLIEGTGHCACGKQWLGKYDFVGGTVVHTRKNCRPSRFAFDVGDL